MTTENKSTEIIAPLKNRFSPREFSSAPVPKNVLDEMFKAAGNSPSAYNVQPWNFFYAEKTDDENYNTLLSFLYDANKSWAVQAPVLILAVANMHNDFTGDINRSAHYDLGGAVANLTVQALANDVYVHQMAGFDKTKAREGLALPDNFEPVTMLAAGYLPDELDRAKREAILKTKAKKNPAEFVFNGKYTKPEDSQANNN